jgi:hypothetical protein
MASSLKYIRFAGIFFLILILSSCIKQFTPALDKNDSLSSLVVEGMITDEIGPFKVHLTQSGPVDKLYSPVPYKGAEVTISENKGNSYQLVDNQNGWYETIDKNLKGDPETIYTLKIRDAEGNSFESTPELMQDVPDIDSVYYTEVKKVRFENGLTYEDNWLNILLDTHDQAGKTNYWFWKFEETWEIKMLTTVRVKHGNPDINAAEIYYSTENVVIDPEKEVCWVSRPSSSVLLHSTVNTDVDSINKFVVQSLGPGEDKLHIRYSILVKQYSLNKESYNYWRQLEKVNEDAPGIYNTIPGPVIGNIQSVSGSKKALGYFLASSVKTRRIFINSADHHIATVSPYDICTYLTDPDGHIVQFWIYFANILNTDIKLWVIYDNYCVDCRAYGTNIKPDFW